MLFSARRCTRIVRAVGEPCSCTTAPTWWIALDTKLSSLLPKAHFLSNIGLLSEIAAGPLEMDFREITAEDDRDTIVTKGNLSRKNGRAFQSNYNFLFQLRDGKIPSGKEFLDAIHVTEIFGAP